MKIAVLYGPRDLRIEDWPLIKTSTDSNFFLRDHTDDSAIDVDNLQPHDIWVKTEITGFKIGTDRGNYEGAEQVPGAPDRDRPRCVGDSNLGIIQGVGNAVTNFKVGDRIVTRASHQSEYVNSIFDDMPVKVPDGVDSEGAVWAHLYTLSGHCYHKAFFRPGEYVAVVGLGVLGLGAVALGPLFGARVVGVGNSPVRLDMAKRMGAHAAYMGNDTDFESKVDEFTGGKGIDLVILTANPWPAFRTSLEIVRQNGRVSVVSLLGRGEPSLDFNPLPMELFYNKGISIIAVSGNTGGLYPGAEDTFAWSRMCEHTLSLMADGLLEPKRLITHRLHYTEMAKAYEMAYSREKSMLGVTFNWKD